MEEQWRSAAVRLLRALQVICAADNIRPLNELRADVGAPKTLDEAIGRIVCHSLYFRANYACTLAVWCIICAIRRPLSALGLTLLAMPSFYALLVCRGVLQVPLPWAPRRGGKYQFATFIYPTLHKALAIGTALLLLLTGIWRFMLWLLLPPLTLALTHAACRAPARRPKEVELLVAELLEGLRAALRGEKADGKAVDVEAVERGDADDEEPQESSMAMAQRVEAIRKKYRPSGGAQDGAGAVRRASAGAREKGD